MALVILTESIDLVFMGLKSLNSRWCGNMTASHNYYEKLCVLAAPSLLLFNDLHSDSSPHWGNSVSALVNNSGLCSRHSGCALCMSL